MLLSDDTIRQVLWPRRAGGRPLFPNAPYLPPGTARLWAETPPSPAEWATWWDAHAGPSREAALVREIASMGGDVGPFVHGSVLRALEKKFSPD